MKIGKGMGVLAARRHKVFMTRSASMFRSLAERHEKAGQPPMAWCGCVVTLPAFRELMMGGLDNGLCCYCKETLTVKTISADHAVPLARGGSSAFENIDFICSGCNRAKGAFTKMEFYGLRNALASLSATYPQSNIMGHVLKSLKIANSFRFGSDRRSKEGKEAAL